MKCFEMKRKNERIKMLWIPRKITSINAWLRLKSERGRVEVNANLICIVHINRSFVTDCVERVCIFLHQSTWFLSLCRRMISMRYANDWSTRVHSNTKFKVSQSINRSEWWSDCKVKHDGDSTHLRHNVFNGAQSIAYPSSNQRYHVTAYKYYNLNVSIAKSNWH